ncbi:hypothetical protein ACVW00_001001 [Marmoricola sp. URHA0025 HA25]
MRRAVLGAVAVLVVVAVLLVVTGCGADPKADPSPAPSTPVTSPVSTTPSAPVLPEEAKANTKAGAVAFVKYYVELINHAQATGDVGSLQAVEAKECRSCANARETLNTIYGAGGHIEGGALSASITSAARRPDPGEWTVFAAVSFGPQKVIRPDGSTSLKGGRSVMTLVVRYQNAAWLVDQWSRGS